MKSAPILLHYPDHGTANSGWNAEAGTLDSQDRETQVAKLAHQIWEDEGRPEGKAEQHWEQAHRQLFGGESAQAEDLAPEAARTPAGENL